MSPVFKIWVTKFYAEDNYKYTIAKYHLKVPHAILFEEFFLSFVWHLIITGGNALPTDPDFTSGPLGILDRVATLIPIHDLDRIQVVR